MPRETIKHPKPFLRVQHKETEDTSSWWEALPFEGYQVDDKGRTLPLPPNTALAFHDSVEIGWSRPAPDNLPVGEEASGSVNVSISYDVFDVQEMLRVSDSDVTQVTLSSGLTRSQINAMIRTLKRARDAAFGADE